MNSLNKFKIPTILGLVIILVGVVGSLYLTNQNQIFTTQAEISPVPSEVLVTNIEDSSVTISWSTEKQATGYVAYLDGTNEISKKDSRDSESPIQRKFHQVKITDLTPNKTYSFKIHSGKYVSQDSEFTTASQDTQNNLGPIIGSVLDGDKFLKEGVVFLEIPGVVVQSAVIGDLGNFIIPINQARILDLTKIFIPQGETATLNIFGEDGRSSEIKFKVGAFAGRQLVPIFLGRNLDLGSETQSSSSATIQNKFDLNGDGVVNVSDHSIVISNLGKNPKNKAADLNHDGIVDKKDVDLIQSEINKFGNQ